MADREASMETEAVIHHKASRTPDPPEWLQFRSNKFSKSSLWLMHQWQAECLQQESSEPPFPCREPQEAMILNNIPDLSRTLPHSYNRTRDLAHPVATVLQERPAQTEWEEPDLQLDQAINRGSTILLDNQILTETEEDFQKMLVPLLIRDGLHLEEIKEEALAEETSGEAQTTGKATSTPEMEDTQEVAETPP